MKANDDERRKWDKSAELGAGMALIEALSDHASMESVVKPLSHVPLTAIIIKGGLTENLSAQMLADIGFAMAVYPFPLISAKIKGVKDTLYGNEGRIQDGSATSGYIFSKAVSSCWI